jgi:glycosyltransferase involved in cell wall biosynthesis
MTPLPVALDATPIDTPHRLRGIGRYVQGLLEGLRELQAAGEVDVPINLVRVAGAAPSEFPEISLARRYTRRPRDMYFENVVRMRGWLRGRAAVYHGTSMEGIALGLPWIATCHDLIPLLLRGEYLKALDLRERLLWHSYAYFLRTRAAHVIADSRYVGDLLVTRFGVSASKVSVAHPGLDAFWSEACSDADAGERLLRLRATPFVLFVGGFDSRKNFGAALQGLLAVPEGQRPLLVVAGADDRRARNEHRRVAPLLAVEFLGYVRDVELRWLYRHARLLAFPSREEGWGFPIVEAMAAGTPVVCSESQSVVEAGDGAALAAAVDDPRAFASAMSSVASNEESRKTRIALGRKRVEKLLWSQTARGVIAAYRQVLSKVVPR